MFSAVFMTDLCLTGNEKSCRKIIVHVAFFIYDFSVKTSAEYPKYPVPKAQVIHSYNNEHELLTNQTKLLTFYIAVYSTFFSRNFSYQL